MRSTWVVALSSGLLALGACRESSPGRLHAEGAYARASAPGAPNGAAFMTLRAEGGPVTVTGGASPACRAVELHTHAREEGAMRMRQLNALEIPAGASLRLEPGGHHVMLIGLEAPLEAGTRVPLTLTLAGGGSLELELPVRPVEAARSAASRPASRPSSQPASRPSSRPAEEETRHQGAEE